MTNTLTVNSDDKLRLDVYLASETEYTRSHIKKLIEGGKVKVNGKIAVCKQIATVGDLIEIEEEELKELDLEPKNISIDIVYQDSDIAVINKEQGMTVHAGSGTKGDTLVNALLYHLDSLSGINGVIRPGIVHRIDKNTSGLLVVAKNDKAHLSLSEQIASKTCGRTYVALCEGKFKNDEGIIDTFIDRSSKDRTMMAVSSGGRRAITHYKVLKRYEGYTFVEFKLETGRTHQIRVHCKYLGNPIVGDDVYGYKNQKFKLNGQLLHAIKLELNHPSSGERMTFTCPMPSYFEEVLKKLKEI